MLARFKEIVLDYTVRLADQVDAEAAEFRAGKSSFEIHRRTLGVILGAAICLLAIRYIGNADDLERQVAILKFFHLDQKAKALQFALTKAPNAKINARILWAVSRLTWYGLVPLLITKFALREKISDFGFSPKQASGYVRLYLTLFAIVAPFVVMASFGEGFQAKYPYYKPDKREPFWPNTALWEAFYASSFVALEYFFRGYLVHGLRRVMGYSAVFVPILPYVMIHYGKPPAEAIGSAITGFVLGTVSLKTRSILGGCGIHIAVAVGMDFLAMWHAGRF
ncbi:MAG: CPBP family intramembrane glutamic endopeptidase [Polyangiaceae bacterium]